MESIIVLIILIVMVAASRISARRTADGKKKVTVQTLAGPVKMNIPKAVKKKEDTEVAVRTAHSSYEDSLRILYKSGLLTRQELNEMMEKHRGRMS